MIGFIDRNKVLFILLALIYSIAAISLCLADLYGIWDVADSKFSIIVVIEEKDNAQTQAQETNTE